MTKYVNCVNKSNKSDLFNRLNENIYNFASVLAVFIHLEGLSERNFISKYIEG